MSVVIKGCQAYSLDAVMEALEEGLAELGGMESLLQAGDQVLLKVNLLQGQDPKKAVTTHPVLVEAITRIIQGWGGQVTIGDSPGGPFTVARLKRAYQAAGFTQVAQRTGAALNFDCSSSSYPIQGGEVINQVQLGEFVKKAHLIINLPKLKTHSLTRITAAVKNLMGTVPGLEKADFHLRFQDTEIFSHFLVDLAMVLPSPLHILDAIYSMEGAGPAKGTPKNTGFLVLAQDPFLLDLTASRLIGLPDDAVPTNRLALERGLIPNHEEILQNLPLSQFQVPDFVVPKLQTIKEKSLEKLPFQLGPAILDYFRPRPVFDVSSCRGCGECEQDCPPKAISLHNKRPVLKLQECIRCFCCQELCPYGAVDIQRPFLGRLFFGG